MSIAQSTFDIPQPVVRRVRRVRRMVRLYVLLEGFAAVVLTVAGLFWGALAYDWLMEPSPAGRKVMWALAIFVTAWVAYRALLSRLLVSLPNTSIAMLLERHFPQLDESLLTTVESAEDASAQSHSNPHLLHLTHRLAAERMEQLPLSEIFRYGPLLWKMMAALALVVSILAFSVLAPEAYSFWLERMQFSQTPWPRRVELTVLGFDQVDNQRVVNVARDDDFELEVLASLTDGHEAPEQVEIRYWLEDGRRGRDTMIKIGEALSGRDDAQKFRYQFKKVTSDLIFDIVGGDDRIEDLRLQVVERPQIFRTTLDVTYPHYMDRSPRSISFSGRTEVPEGSHVHCLLESSKPLEAIQVHEPASQHDLQATVSANNPQLASFDLDLDSADRVLLITLHDQDGVQNREPYRIIISALPDEPPEVSVQLRGIGAAVTPEANIPLAGRVSDHYGIEELWYEYQINDRESRQRPLDLRLRGMRSVTDLASFDLTKTNPDTERREIELEPGDQLALSLLARDAYDLGTEPHLGTSQRFLLQVVTPSELRSLLERKELALRQRFEAIYEKTIGTNTLLTRIEPEPDNGSAAAEEDAEAVRRLERDRLRVEGALQNIVQVSFEIAGVAEGFDDIVAEMVNNRIDTEDLTQRIEQGISAPLRGLVDEPLGQFEQELTVLLKSFENGPPSEEQLARTMAQGELVAELMKQILDRMLELESYNELVELLRDIVEEHEQLQEKTRQQRKERLRDLLGGD